MNKNINQHVVPQIVESNHVIAVMRQHLMEEHAQIVRDAKKTQLAKVRDEFCMAFGVEKAESTDDEGGGSITLRFPLGWNEDQAETFAANCLDLDLSHRDGGAGQYFQCGGVSTDNTGIVWLGMSWGFDI